MLAQFACSRQRHSLTQKECQRVTLLAVVTRRLRSVVTRLSNSNGLRYEWAPYLVLALHLENRRNEHVELIIGQLGEIGLPVEEEF